MDLDAYVAAKSPQWRRLEELTGRKRLSGAEADEVLDLYQRTATHLSVVRSAAPEPDLVGYLSWLLTRARGTAARPASRDWRAATRFFTDTFPATLYRTRRWWLAVLAANVLAAVFLGWWFLANPQVEQSLMTPGEIDQLVNHDFAHYYSEHAASSFAFRVWTNNAFVAAQCIAFGILGAPVIWVLFNNILNVSIIGALMIRHDRADVFFGLISPHGILELTCVFVAAGVGLRIFWGWVEPGARTRGQAVAQEARAAMSVALGLIVVLLICGLIEAFVTPSPLPTAARVGIGVVAEAAFFAYVFTLGKWAVRRGETGDVATDQAGYVAPARD
ncbi:MAG: stage II sporulation protein M [Austwickia sp.]|nr:MAG: stage II sporulation protein M [Austwickia sp.]